MNSASLESLNGQKVKGWPIVTQNQKMEGRDKMLVRCERDKTVFEVEPRQYLENKITHFYRKDGPDMLIDCPTCSRGYFLDDQGQYISDRVLTILKK